MEKRLKIFLVDDDAVYIKLLAAEFLAHVNYDITCFSSGEQCLKNITQHPDIVVLDFHLDGIQVNAMNGLQTLVAIKEFNQGIPVIMLSSQDKIDVAVQCMHNKANDYIVKSETAFMRLQKSINAILLQKKMEKQLAWYMDRM